VQVKLFSTSIKYFTYRIDLVIHDCNKEIIELLLNHGANAQCEDKVTGTTAIQMAVIRGNLLTTQLLVAHGANTKTLSKVESTINTISYYFRSIFFSRVVGKHCNNWLYLLKNRYVIIYKNGSI
jgi:ankyrin repeat protein